MKLLYCLCIKAYVFFIIKKISILMKKKNEVKFSIDDQEDIIFDNIYSMSTYDIYIYKLSDLKEYIK